MSIVRNVTPDSSPTGDGGFEDAALPKDSRRFRSRAFGRSAEAAQSSAANDFARTLLDIVRKDLRGVWQNLQDLKFLKNSPELIKKIQALEESYNSLVDAKCEEMGCNRQRAVGLVKKDLMIAMRNNGYHEIEAWLEGRLERAFTATRNSVAMKDAISGSIAGAPESRGVTGVTGVDVVAFRQNVYSKYHAERYKMDGHHDCAGLCSRVMKDLGAEVFVGYTGNWAKIYGTRDLGGGVSIRRISQEEASHPKPNTIYVVGYDNGGGANGHAVIISSDANGSLLLQEMSGRAKDYEEFKVGSLNRFSNKRGTHFFFEVTTGNL